MFLNTQKLPFLHTLKFCFLKSYPVVSPLESDRHFDLVEAMQLRIRKLPLGQVDDMGVCWGNDAMVLGYAVAWDAPRLYNKIYPQLKSGFAANNGSCVYTPVTSKLIKTMN